MFEGFSSVSIRSDREVGSVEVYSKKRKILQFIATTLTVVAFQMSVMFKSSRLEPCVGILVVSRCVARVHRSDHGPVRLELGLFDRMACNVLLGCTNRFGIIKLR